MIAELIFVAMLAQQRPAPPSFGQPPPQKAKPQPPTLVLPPEPPSEVHSDKDPNPKGPKAPAGKQTATLRWADPNVPVADTFIIWRGDGECTTYKVLTQIKTGVKQSPYVDSTIRPNRVYCYAVSAVYGGTESAQSNFATATPPKTKNDKE